METVQEIVSAPRVIFDAMKVFQNFQKFSKELLGQLEENRTTANGIISY